MKKLLSSHFPTFKKFNTQFLSVTVLALLGTGVILTVNQTKQQSSTNTRAQMMHDDPTCGFGGNMAFCDTFSEKHPGGRGGDLDEKLWHFARLTQANNLGSGLIGAIFETDVHFCTQYKRNVLSPDNSFFCGPESGESMHWMTGMRSTEEGGYVNFTGTIRQPFDFSSSQNRKHPGYGTITMDVDAKSIGHGSWIEIWVTEDPIPAPHVIIPGNQAVPKMVWV